MFQYMLTMNDKYPIKKVFEIFRRKYDVKKWIICREMGENGYKHYHIRCKVSGVNFEQMKKFWDTAHIEECQDVWDYEKKDGHYWTSEDTIDILKIRFGKKTKFQEDVIKELDKQSDREIDVWIDSVGNHGKTWLALHMWETGQALIIPRAQATPEKISAYICSAYQGEPYIFIDIPRSAPIPKSLYETLEEVKDGLVFDMRYSGKCRSIRGAKVCVFCNKKLDLKSLSADRWKLHGVRAGDTLS